MSYVKAKLEFDQNSQERARPRSMTGRAAASADAMANMETVAVRLDSTFECSSQVGDGKFRLTSEDNVHNLLGAEPSRAEPSRAEPSRADSFRSTGNLPSNIVGTRTTLCRA